MRPLQAQAPSLQQTSAEGLLKADRLSDKEMEVLLKIQRRARKVVRTAIPSHRKLKAWLQSDEGIQWARSKSICEPLNGQATPIRPLLIVKGLELWNKHIQDRKKYTEIHERAMNLLSTVDANDEWYQRFDEQLQTLGKAEEGLKMAESWIEDGVLGPLVEARDFDGLREWFKKVEMIEVEYTVLLEDVSKFFDKATGEEEKKAQDTRGHSS